MLYLSLLAAAVAFSIAFFSPLTCSRLTCMWMREQEMVGGGGGLRARDKEAIWTVH